VYSASLLLNGISTSDFNNANYQTGFVTGIANGFNAHSPRVITSNEVVITGFESSTRLSIARMLTDSTQVRFKISIVIEEFGLDRTNSFSSLDSIVTDAISSGDLTSAMNSALQESVGGGFSGITVSDFISSEADSAFTVLSTTSPTASPTDMKSSSNTASFLDNEWTLAFIIVAIIMSVLLMVSCVLRIRDIKKSNKLSTIYLDTSYNKNMDKKNLDNKLTTKPNSNSKSISQSKLKVCPSDAFDDLQGDSKFMDEFIDTVRLYIE
jgi:hypothetical protein